MKRALITGITGQDGSYLTELLINKGYKVYGIKRRSSLFNTKRIDYLYQDPHNVGTNLIFYYGDLTDSSNLIRIIQEVQPDEIYNLAAQSHVKVAFGVPEYTANVNALGVLRLLEAIRALGLERKIRFYQASSSELFGDTNEIPQNEDTPFKPCSPYACAKLYAYWCVDGYRKAYNMFAVNGILFNHESPRRGETFVTRKITRGAVRIALGLQEKLYLGNLNSKRDWGHARDYCFPAGTKILVKNNNGYHKLQSKPIEDILIGDEVLSWNGQCKEYDKVVRLFVRESNDFVNLKFSNGNKLKVTSNHPIAVNKKGEIKWVEAERLKVGDEIIQYLHYSISFRISNLKNKGKSNIDRFGKKKAKNISGKIGLSRKGRTYEELVGKDASIDWKCKVGKASKMLWLDEEYREKMSGLKGTYEKYYGLKKALKIKQKMSYIAKGMWNKFSKKEKADRVTKAWRTFNKSERKLFEILERVCPRFFKYNGDGKEQRKRGLSFERMIPDFISKDKNKKVIDFFSEYYHKGGDREEGERIRRLKELGYDCLVIWGNELRDKELVENKVRNFIFNPNVEVVEVVSIKKCLKKSIPVFNIETQKNHNYFAYGILVHNCRAMWLMLQQNEPEDFVIATGEQHSIREFCERAFGILGIELEWKGIGLNEKGIIKKIRNVGFEIKIIGLRVGREIICIDPCYYRPVDVNNLLGDSWKAYERLGWSPTISFDEMVFEMITNDYKEVLRERSSHIIPSCEEMIFNK